MYINKIGGEMKFTADEGQPLGAPYFFMFARTTFGAW